jgi:hypothetical protein
MNSKQSIKVGKKYEWVPIRYKNSSGETEITHKDGSKSREIPFDLNDPEDAAFWAMSKLEGSHPVKIEITFYDDSK